MLVPTSTYRIQLHAGFTFRQLRSILDYLHDLGISTIYASPITKAIKGSQHGYDAADPLSINPEIGTEEELKELSALLQNYGMTWLQDIVPNHMAFTDSNPWLYDVLERGKDSPFYSFFDIDTNPSDELTGDKLMAPFLGSTLTECLQKGELTLELTSRGFFIRYFENSYPVAISLYPWIATISEGPRCPPALLTLLQELDQAARSSQSAHPSLILSSATSSTPGSSSPATLPQTDDWTTTRKKLLDNIFSSEEYTSFLIQRVNFFNQQPSLLTELAGEQHYILTHAHLAASRINYRRFFTVNSLICLRMEDLTVFTAWHEQIHSWYKKGYIQGLRLDHIDGLAAPRQYIDRLRQRFGDDCYIVAEKILEEGETMPANWQLQGMTGYEFLSPVSQVLTDPDGSRELLAFYQEHIADRTTYEEIVFQRKQKYLQDNMGGELDNLLHLLYSLPLLGAEAAGNDIEDGHTKNNNKARMKKALALLLSSFPVYRLYPDSMPLPPDSHAHLATAFARSREKGPDVTQELDFLEKLFTGDNTPGSTLPVNGSPDPLSNQRLRFQSRFMQFTSPLAAKGIEDTTFYVYHPYIAHNEVGDTPAIAGITPETFHEKMASRQTSLPFSINATSTHDTKRGEDNRIRLNLLSAIPDQWIASVKKWEKINRSRINDTAGHPAPTRNDEYLVYQALLGGFPEDLVVTDSFRQRFHDYLTKALREGNTNTSYNHPDEIYEGHCHSFVTAILEPDSPFLEDFIPFAWQIIRESFTYSLSQLLIKLTAPGIPDIYQGAELWELSFVDPDNRRSIDYSRRMTLLKEIKEEEAKGAASALAFVRANRKKGACKLFTIYRTLSYRNTHPEVFTSGDYIPVPARGPVLAYLRHHKKDWALIVVPLIRQGATQPITVTLSLPPDIPASWTNIFTGKTWQPDIPVSSSGPSPASSTGPAKGPSNDPTPASSSNPTSGPSLSFDSLFDLFPVALLTGQTP
ncbi:MAG TPA: malto-oligosyltrehalose synthase [Puia sp.]|jgi:(1->4)-alpha-D-glucan 1-alpha-D-glucosylmutase